MSKRYVAVKDGSSCPNAMWLSKMLSHVLQAFVSPQEFQGSLCSVQARRNEVGHPCEKVWGKIKWPLPRHGLQSRNERPGILVSGPLLHGRCTSSGNHHAVPTALIATPISAITTAVSGTDQ